MDTGSRKDIRAAEKSLRNAAIEDAETVRAICSTAASRRWLWDQLEACGIFRTTFSPDAAIAAFNEGNRNAGLRLLAQVMEHCPEQYILMTRESNDRRARTIADSRSAAERGGDDSDSTAAEPDDGRDSRYHDFG